MSLLDKPKYGAFRRRLRAVMIIGFCAAMLVIAWSLKPRGCGFGTAQQLGMPACSVLVKTGWPCPSCGLTTSVAAAVRGRFLLSLRSQPFGLLLTMTAMVLGLASLADLVSGRNFLGVFHLNWWWLVGGFAAMLAGWGVKLIIGITEGTLPLR